MREKVGKSRNTVFFEWFVAPEGRKVGSLNRRVRSRQFFRPGPLRGTKNHVKTTVFCCRRPKKMGSAEATKHSK